MILPKWSWASLLSRCLLLLLLFTTMAHSASLLPAQKNQFAAIYQSELGPIYDCPNNTEYIIGFCSDALKSAPNAPHILIPKTKPSGLVILLHGLSDSPYFVRGIGEYLQQKGYVVILPLSPGHGKKEAQEDMRDPLLQQRWYKHVRDVMDFAQSFDLPIALGGYSTGAALSAQYALQQYSVNKTHNLTALVFFSGALALPSAGEALGKVWGMKTMAKWIDGDYITAGPHPYKYPKIAGYSALVLLDVIKDVRHIIRNIKTDEKSMRLPVFAAHSIADRITPFEGVRDFLDSMKGEHVVFKIDEDFDLCHADLPMSQLKIMQLKFDKSKVNQRERCAVPKANPLFRQMMYMLEVFLSEHMVISEQATE